MSGLLVSAIQQPLVAQQEIILLPDEALDLAGLSAAEHGQDILLKRIKFSSNIYRSTT